MTDDEAEPSRSTAAVWEDLLEDAAAIADEYRERDWDVVSLRPGDVSPATNEERYGFSVLVPGSEYDELEAVVERDDAAFEAAEVYRRTVSGTVFLVAVELDEGTETAVVVPVRYSAAEFDEILETARDEGAVELHVRPLSIENWVTFSHDDPSLFLPNEDEE